MTKEQDLRVRVGTLVKNLPELHDLEYKVGFNLHENTYFQKLISKEVMEKGVRVTPRSYFKAIMFLTYFTSVIEGDYKVCDDLVTLSKTLRAEEREAGKDGVASYLGLDVVVAEAGLCAKEKKIGSDKVDVLVAKSRYDNQATPIDFDSGALRPIEPYYEGIGQMVCDLVSEERRELLMHVNSRAELEALVFTDCVLGLLKDATYRAKAEELLKKRDYLTASLIAIEGLRKEMTLSRMDAIVNEGKND